MAAAREADVVVMAAAVADFRPADVAADKIKKDESADGAPEPIALVRNPDVLAGLVAARARGPCRARRCSSGSPPRPATPRAIRSPTPGPSWPARASTCSCSTTCPAGAVFGRPDNEVHLLTADGAVDGPHAGSQGRRSHTPSGTAWSDCAPAPPRISSSTPGRRCPIEPPEGPAQ